MRKIKMILTLLSTVSCCLIIYYVFNDAPLYVLISAGFIAGAYNARLFNK